MDDKKLAGISVLMISLMAIGSGAPSMAVPLTPAPQVELVPHRAIYDLSLQNATAGSNVSEIRGRLVFDFAGSECKGYTLKSRLVTELVDRDGQSTLTDMRSESWEEAEGGTFRFDSAQYVNRQLSEEVVGEAKRGGDAGNVDVSLDKPGKTTLKLAGKPLFPTQHSFAILKAAQLGERVVQADLYDGSEKGATLFQTTTFIGNPIQPGQNEAVSEIENIEKLKELVSWPVSISYFEHKDNPVADEGIPTYELSFRLFANGVSRRLKIDYGNFSMNGLLSSLDFYPPEACSKKKGGQ